MNNKPKTKLLTISLLCCGRPDTTERCLKSLMPIREAIDSEIQVVDTGCTPETRAIIEKYADEIFEFKWVNDFAAARNFQLDQANGKMFLFIDDDEWFLDVKYIIDFFNQADCLTYNLGGYYQRNYLDFDGVEYQDIEVVRMCLVTPETVFIGKVHEYIEPAFGNAIFLDARAGHFGYVYKNEEENLKHGERNVPLLKEMMEEQPDNLRWPYQLVQELRALKRYEEMLEVCHEGIKKTFEIDDNDSLRYRATFVVGVVAALTELKRSDELLDFYREQMAKDDVTEVPKAKLSLYAARIMFMKDLGEECEKACNYYIDVMNRYKDDRGLMFIEGGIFINDTFDETHANSIYAFLMGSAMKRDDFGPLVHYYRKIAWNSPVVYINRGFIIILLVKAAEYGGKKEIRDVLSKFFIRPGLRDALENEINVSCKDMTVDQYQKMKEAFEGTIGEKELGMFIDIRIMEHQIGFECDYEKLADILDDAIDYGKLTEEHRKLHLSWMEDGCDPDRDTEDYKLGQALFDFIEQSQNNPTEALKILKSALGLRPMMDGFIKRLSRLYADYQKVITAKMTDPEKFTEMYNLEEALLQQIAELDAAGKTDEAVTTYQQLINVIKNTYGVETLHV